MITVPGPINSRALVTSNTTIVVTGSNGKSFASKSASDLVAALAAVDPLLGNSSITVIASGKGEIGPAIFVFVTTNAVVTPSVDVETYGILDDTNWGGNAFIDSTDPKNPKTYYTGNAQVYVNGVLTGVPVCMTDCGGSDLSLGALVRITAETVNGFKVIEIADRSTSEFDGNAGRWWSKDELRTGLADGSILNKFYAANNNSNKLKGTDIVVYSGIINNYNNGVGFVIADPKVGEKSITTAGFADKFFLLFNSKDKGADKKFAGINNDQWKDKIEGRHAFVYADGTGKILGITIVATNKKADNPFDGW
jgi:hypothetical protein